MLLHRGPLRLFMNANEVFDLYGVRGIPRLQATPYCGATLEYRVVHPSRPIDTVSPNPGFWRRHARWPRRISFAREEQGSHSRLLPGYGPRRSVADNAS